MTRIAAADLLARDDTPVPARRLADAIEGMGAPTILVVGDLILDRYVWGSVDRVSPEAPVPVLRTQKREARLGGAGSVIANLVKLGANVVPFGVLGADEVAEEFRAGLRRLGVPDAGIIEGPQDRPTTVKTRLLGGQQQLLRVDSEVATPYPEAIDDALFELIAARAAEADLILCSDYDKGLFGGGLLPRIAALGRSGDRPVPVVADPRKDPDYARYRDLWGVTPNRRETELATGQRVMTLEDARGAARKLLSDLGLHFVALTLDRDGILIAVQDGRFRHFPTRPRAVYDVTGAGDMVLSMLGLGLAGGLGLSVAAPLANAAGGLEVERVGVQPLGRDEIAREVLGHAAQGPGNLRTWEEVEAVVAEARRRGERVVFTNGCFDILHIGHIRSLRYARSLGDLLVVGLNTDASVHQNKGPSRPINDQIVRAEQLGALEAVDHVVFFDDETPYEVVKHVRPDVLVKGEDYRDKVVVGQDLVESWGGRVEFAPLTPGVSTTRLLEALGDPGRGEKSEQQQQQNSRSGT